jgi:hypothetical protein
MWAPYHRDRERDLDLLRYQPGGASSADPPQSKRHWRLTTKLDLVWFQLKSHPIPRTNLHQPPMLCVIISLNSFTISCDRSKAQGNNRQWYLSPKCHLTDLIVDLLKRKVVSVDNIAVWDWTVPVICRAHQYWTWISCPRNLTSLWMV